MARWQQVVVLIALRVGAVVADSSPGTCPKQEGASALENCKQQGLSDETALLQGLISEVSKTLQAEQVHTDLHSARQLLFDPHRHDLRELKDLMIQNVNLMLKPLKSNAEQCLVESEKWMQLGTRMQNEDPIRTPRTFHTGMFLSNTANWQNASIKIRLGLLSILASQDLRDTKVTFWADDLDNTLLQDSLGGILAHEDFAKVISVSKFDPHAEFAKMSPAHGNMLATMFADATMLPSKSDLFRLAILRNYGGMWVDTDVLMIHDFLPLVDMDWAYLMKDNFVNNALISVSKPESPFVSALLSTIADRGIEGAKDRNIYKFGPTLFKELHEDPKAASTFSLLPGCFFDGACGGGPSIYPDDFFNRPAKDEEKIFIMPNDPRNKAFAYHWHGRWDMPIVDGSLATIAERMYLDKLHLTL